MLAYLLLSKVAGLTQSNLLSPIFPYVHFCLTTCQEHWYGSICWHINIRSSSIFEYYCQLVSEASPLLGGGWETLYCHTCLYFLYVYLCIFCMFITRRVHGRFYGLDLKKNKQSFWKTRARFISDEENCCRIKDRRLENESTHSLCGCCQEKVLF